MQAVMIPYETADELFEVLQVARVMARCEGLADLEAQVREAMAVIRFLQDRSRAASGGSAAPDPSESEAAR